MQIERERDAWIGWVGRSGTFYIDRRDNLTALLFIDCLRYYFSIAVNLSGTLQQDYEGG